MLNRFFGLITYVLIQIFSGNGRKFSPLMIILSILFAPKLAFPFSIVMTTRRRPTCCAG